METIDLHSSITVLVFLNGDSQTNGTPMTVDTSTSMENFLRQAGDVMDITPLGIALTRAFTEDGREITSPSALAPNAKIYLSAGEPFVAPAVNEVASAPALSPGGTPASLHVHAPEDGAIPDSAAGPHPVTPPSGPLETVATTAASLLYAGYSLASHYVKQWHPPTGQRLENVENAVRENLGSYAAQSAPAVRGGLRWADRQLSSLVSSLRQHRDAYLASPQGQRLKAALAETQAAVAESVAHAASATAQSVSTAAAGVGMTAAQVYAHAAEAYREGLSTVTGAAQGTPSATQAPNADHTPSASSSSSSSSSSGGDMSAFVQRLSTRMGSLWHDSLVPSAHALYHHMQHVHGQTQGQSEGQHAQTLAQRSPAGSNSGNGNGSVYVGRYVARAPGAQDAGLGVSAFDADADMEGDDVNHVQPHTDGVRGRGVGDIDMLLD